MKTLLALIALAMFTQVASAQDKPSPSVVTTGSCFELRTYTAAPGKLEALHARFRDHTCKLFEKHGMKLVWFGVPQEKGSDDTLVYLLQHKSRAAAEESWKAFRADPDWIAAKAESEKNGSLTVKVEFVFLNPTDYSALK